MIRRAAFFLFLFFCAHPVFAQGSSLSISPSEVEFSLAPSVVHTEHLLLQRSNADSVETYRAQADNPSQLSGVHVDIGPVVFAQGDTAEDVSYTMSCDATCPVSSGDVVIRFEPVLSADQMAPGQTQLGIAQRVHVTVVALAEQLYTSVLADRFLSTDDAVTFQRVDSAGLFAASLTVATTLTFANTASVDLLQLPYTVAVYRNGMKVQSQAGVLSQSLTSQSTSTAPWTGTLPGIGIYRIVFSAAGEHHTVTLFVFPLQKSWGWILVFLSSCILFATLRKILTRREQNGISAVHVQRGVLAAGMVLCGLAIIAVAITSLPHMQQVDSFLYNTSLGLPSFMVVNDANRTTIIRLRDGKTDYLPGSWNIFAQTPDYFYAFPVFDDPRTQQGFFYRIFPDGIQPISTTPLHGQITRVIDNVPGTYAVASTDQSTCIFFLADEHAPACQDLSAVLGNGDVITNYAWNGDSGEYLTLQIQNTDGTFHLAQYDVWNHTVSPLDGTAIDSGVQFSAAEPITFLPPRLAARFLVPLFGHTVRAPWNTRIAKLNDTLSAALLPHAGVSDLALVNTKNQYHTVLSISHAAQIFYIEKGTFITSPVILER